MTVTSSAWMGVGQVVYHSNGGYYRVDETPTPATVSLINLGYPTNPVPGTTIVHTGAIVSPAGEIGPASETIIDNFVLTAGDIMAKQVTLSATPANASAVLFTVQDGPVLSVDIDYVVVAGTPPALSWQDKELDAVLSVGDVLVARYSKLYAY